MNTSFDLTGHVAFVTGASSGLGAHFAQTLADAGAKVVIGARRADRLSDLADRITVLVYGQVIATGAPDDIRNDPAVREAYLGEDDSHEDSAEDSAEDHPGEAV